MAEEVLPLIGARDYPAFRKLMPEELPATYRGWLECCHRKEIAERQRKGLTVREIPVHLDDFRGWLRDTGKPASVQALWHCAVHVADRDYRQSQPPDSAR